MIYLLIFQCLNYLLVIIPLLLSVAFMTLFERKVMGLMQMRKGPNVIGFFGVLQPIADGLKLFLKGPIIPYKSDKLLFFFCPIYTFMLSIINWSVLPLLIDRHFFNFELSLLIVFGISSLGVYGIVLAGWASNSKYAFFGALRSAAQLIAYEISLGLALLPVILLTQSLNLNEIIYIQEQTIWFLFPLFPVSFVFFVSCLAETNRSPFDLPEAEGELVAGFNVEYSSMSFALFFLAEYANILFMSILFVIFFLGGGSFWFFYSNFIFKSFVSYHFLFFLKVFIFFFKVLIVLFLFVWVRATFPRLRFDQLLILGWKTFLPFTMAYFIYVSYFLFFFFVN